MINGRIKKESYDGLSIALRMFPATNKLWGQQQTQQVDGGTTSQHAILKNLRLQDCRTILG